MPTKATWGERPNGGLPAPHLDLELEDVGFPGSSLGFKFPLQGFSPGSFWLGQQGGEERREESSENRPVEERRRLREAPESCRQTGLELHAHRTHQGLAEMQTLWAGHTQPSGHTCRGSSLSIHERPQQHFRALSPCRRLGPPPPFLTATLDNPRQHVNTDNSDQCQGGHRPGSCLAPGLRHRRHHRPQVSPGQLQPASPPRGVRCMLRAGRPAGRPVLG